MTSSKRKPSHNYNVYVFKKNQIMFGKINAFNRFIAGTAPDFKKTHFYKKKNYFKMQYAILPMSLRHEPRCSLCQMAPIFLSYKT